MNPYGDLESIARAHCMLKPGGVFFLGLPTGGPDQMSNQHRIYGKYRVQLFLEMWELVDMTNNRIRFNDTDRAGDCNNQPVMVLRKKDHRSKEGSRWRA